MKIERPEQPQAFDADRQTATPSLADPCVLDWQEVRDLGLEPDPAISDDAN